MNKQTRIWMKRIERRAVEHGVTNLTHLRFNAEHVIRHNALKLGTSDFFAGNLTQPATLNDLIKDGLLQTAWLGLVSYEWVDDETIQVSSIPYAAGRAIFDPDLVAIANYDYLKEKYADLFPAAVMVEINAGLYLNLDQRYYSRDRLLELAEDLERLENYPILDENLHSKLEMEKQEATVINEASSFDRELNMADFVKYPLMQAVTGETKEEITARFNPVYPYKKSEAQKQAFDLWERFLVSHMWDLIRQHELEFGDDSAYIDVDKLVSLSPLKDFGQTAINALYGQVAELDHQLTQGFVGTMYSDTFTLVSAIKQELQYAVDDVTKF
jgi:hypothetical protein